MKAGHIALRKGRQTVAGQPYLVTFTTHDRRSLFRCPRLAAAACRAIEDARLWRRASLQAWVLMPDHWHGLVVAGDAPLSRLVQRIKCNVARAVNLERGGRGAVWADAFHDRGLRNKDDLVAIAGYVVMNPVRAGLVASVGQYPYWNAVWV